MNSNGDEEKREFEPELLAKSGSPEPKEGRCGTKLAGSSQTGVPRYCMGYPEKGMRRCRRHSSGQVRPENSGITASSFKTGKYAKHFPGSLKEQYNRAVNDRTLLSLHDEIAAIEA